MAHPLAHILPFIMESTFFWYEEHVCVCESLYSSTEGKMSSSKVESNKVILLKNCTQYIISYYIYSYIIYSILYLLPFSATLYGNVVFPHLSDGCSCRSTLYMMHCSLLNYLTAYNAVRLLNIWTSNNINMLLTTIQHPESAA